MKNPSTADIAELKTRANDKRFESLVENYVSTLSRLREIGREQPAEATRQAQLDSEETELLSENEQLINTACAMKAESLAGVRNKLELWRMDVLGATPAENPSDQLILSVIDDLERLIRRQAG
ncbi:hypothetical protein ACFOOP_09540 [Marinicaulis aureus]|uniref:Uncharacterized protein n=1 Tax=Hyphococcus aureus TaxID=2666033 RepID=A0ABW1KQW4_9PROT